MFKFENLLPSLGNRWIALTAALNLSSRLGVVAIIDSQIWNVGECVCPQKQSKMGFIQTVEILDNRQKY